MRRYFFDFRDGDDVIPDEEGVLILNLDKVQEEAARALADLVRDELRSKFAKGPTRLAVEVRDEDGLVMQAKLVFELTRLQ